MESITLIEHETLPIHTERTYGQKALSKLYANALQRIEGKLPAKILSWGHNSIKFANYCGVICLGRLTLEILPKIYGKETEPGSCRNALIKMLVKARKLKLKKGATSSISLQKNSFLDVFILHFCELLHSELMQGMIRHYIENKENLAVMRGRLRVEQQFKLNLAHKERLFCQYDELSANNAHNQVIKFVLRQMVNKASGIMARKKVGELLMRFDSISDVNVDIQMIDNLTFNRSTSRYEPILQQCRWFLQGLHPDVLVGKNSCMSLLFDMNKLFECYVARVFRKLAWMAGIRMREQGPQKYMMRRNDTDQQIFLMKPDMVFLENENSIVSIADAKWKMLDEREKKLCISQGDLYQMASYAARYGINRLAIVYPKQQWLTNKIDFKIQRTSVSLEVIPIDLNSNTLPTISIF